MTPYWLTVVGVLTPVILSSGLTLEKSERALRLLLFTFTLPLCVFAGLAFMSPEDSLSLWGYGVSNGQLLSVTVQYDQPNGGLGVIESALKLEHPLAFWLSATFLASAVLSLISSLRDTRSPLNKNMATIASGTWLVTGIAYLLTHQTLSWDVQGGESAVRNFFKWSNLDPLRVSQFVVPTDTWQYFSPQNALFIFSLFSAFMLFGVHSELFKKWTPKPAEGEEQKVNKDWYHRYYTIGALLSTVGTLWLASTQGFTGIPSESVYWIVTVAMACSSVLNLPAVSKASIASLCLLALSFQVL
jgi:hypothetical protein